MGGADLSQIFPQRLVVRVLMQSGSPSSGKQGERLGLAESEDVSLTGFFSDVVEELLCLRPGDTFADRPIIEPGVLRGVSYKEDRKQSQKGQAFSLSGL